MRRYRLTIIVVVALGLRCGGANMRTLQAPAASTNPIVQSDIPSRQHCQNIHFMLNAGFWLHVRRDGRHAIGFGALPQSVAVHPKAFDIDQVYEAVAPYVLQQHDLIRSMDEETGSFQFSAVFLAHDGTDTYRSYLLATEVNPYMKALFRRAYHSTDSSRTFTHDYETMRRFWENAPFLSNE